jgi:hypothetical protein
MITLLHRFLNIKGDFEKIFFTNEYQKLVGPKNRTILTLLAILLLTYMALAFAIGSVQNLQKKMDNPFTNWVDLEVKESKIAHDLPEINARYNKANIKEQLQIKNIGGWTKTWFLFHKANFNPFKNGVNDSLFQLPGRTIEDTEPLIGKILDKNSSNLLWSAPDFDINKNISFNECQLIINEDMALRLGYSDYANISMLKLRDQDSQNKYNSNIIFIKVVAVVKELPNFCNFIMSPKLYNILTSQKDNSKFCNTLIISNLKEGENSFQYIIPENSSTDDLQQLANQFFGTKSEANISSNAADGLIKTSSQIYQPITLSFLPNNVPPTDTLKKFVDFCKNKFPIADYATIDCGADACDVLESGNYNYVAFNFDRLDKVRAFSTDLKDQFNITIDMSQVEAKENFALVANLTIAISFILLIFGILTIVLFVRNLIKMHLYEVRSNLGTFQAFGLSNTFLSNIYVKIIFSFLLIAITGSLFITIIVDRIEQLLMKQDSCFNIFSLWIFLATIGLIIFSLIICRKSVANVLSDTPGNLIYER